MKSQSLSRLAQKHSVKVVFLACSSIVIVTQELTWLSRLLTHKVDLSLLCSEDRQNLKVEAAIHAKLSHPGIIRFLGSSQNGSKLHIFLEYASNGCLYFYNNTQAGLPEAIALRFLLQVARAVSYLHALGIAHRDIKPENVLLDEDMNAKLCDFGWATALHTQAQTIMCGTFEYMAPEVCYGDQQTLKMDVWSLGVLLFELLHGWPPFKANSIEELRQKFEVSGVEITAAMTPTTRSLLASMLKSKPGNRPRVDEVVTHPALQAISGDLWRPLSAEDRQLLHRNFCMNTGSFELPSHATNPYAVKSSGSFEANHRPSSETRYYNSKASTPYCSQGLAQTSALCGFALEPGEYRGISPSWKPQPGKNSPNSPAVAQLLRHRGDLAESPVIGSATASGRPGRRGPSPTSWQEQINAAWSRDVSPAINSPARAAGKLAFIPCFSGL